MKNKDSGFKTKNAGISVVVILAMVISGLAVLAAPAAIAEDNMGGSYGGTLRVALKSAPSSLNPLASNLNESANQIIDVLYDSLGRIDPYTLEIKPWMASSWTIDATNDSIVSVKMKSGIKWHDGTLVTLDDVQYTFGANGYNINYLSSMTKDSANNTIIFKLKAPNSKFFSEMMLKKVVPNGFTSTMAPKGCGPFKLVSTNSISTEIAAFNDHFNARPYIDSMIYTYYPYTTIIDPVAYPYTVITEDPRFEGFYRAAYDLITNKVDYIGWDLTTNQTTANVEVGGNNTNLFLNSNSTLVRSSGLKQWYLGFNNAETNITNNVAIRKAISYAINKQALTVYDISGGLEMADSVISKYNLPWYNNTIVPHGYDITEAKQILKDAKYVDYNSDGYVEKPGPVIPKSGYENISLTLLGPQIEDVTPYTMSTNIITWFEILGIKVTLVSNTADANKAAILSDNFDMYLANEESATLDPQFISDMYKSSAIASNKNLLNFEGTLKIQNFSLISQIKDNQTWVANLNHTNLVDPILVYHNNTLVPPASYTVDYESGKFTLDQTFALDYANDTLNITYSYLPFDHLIEKADSQMNPVMRMKYLKEVQALLADLEPSVPLFSYRVSHAYRVNVFTGWVPTLGGVNNYWTFTNLKNAIVGDTVATLSSAENFLTEGENLNLFLKVLDLNGAPIFNSTLVFTGEGTFGTPAYDVKGQQYTVKYTAPATSSSKTITITAEVYTIGYTMDSDTIDITVHPQVNNINLEITRGATSLDSGNTTSVTVRVMDRADSSVISGATVVLTMTPAGLGGYLEKVTGTTNTAGQFVTNFGSKNVTIDTTFRITATVTKEGYVDSVQTTSISVKRDLTIQGTTNNTTTEVGRGFLGLPAPSFLTVLILLSGMSVVYVVYRRKRN
jgi:ABC-type transport system substrate-binding protein